MKNKPKKIPKIDDIAHRTITNFKEITKKRFFSPREEEKNSHKLKRLPTNTLGNFNQNNKTVHNSPKKTSEQTKIRKRNLTNIFINEKILLTKKGDGNKTNVQNTPEKKQTGKKLGSSKSFVLNTFSNNSKEERKLTLNQTKTIYSKKGIKVRLIKNNKKGINELEKINEIINKKEIINKTTKNSKDKDIKKVKKKEKEESRRNN